MWRISKANEKGEFIGGYHAWNELGESDWDLNITQFHPKARTPYIFDTQKRRFLAYENSQSITEKVY
jgi:GH18 family chitinase